MIFILFYNFVLRSKHLFYPMFILKPKNVRWLLFQIVWHLDTVTDTSFEWGRSSVALSTNEFKALFISCAEWNVEGELWSWIFQLNIMNLNEKLQFIAKSRLILTRNLKLNLPTENWWRSMVLYLVIKCLTTVW